MNTKQNSTNRTVSSKTHYKAVLFSPDGAHVTDFKNKTKEEVNKEIENMGSRWIFYPFPFVATNKTIVDVCHGFDFLKGKRINTAKKFFENNTEAMTELLTR